jgi:hypothetical protein
MAEAAARITGAIILEAFALVVWNVGAYSPIAILHELVRLSRDARALLLRLLAFIAGLTFVAAATILLVPAVGDAWDAFIPIEILTLGVALVVDFLIGNDLRRLLRLPTTES